MMLTRRVSSSAGVRLRCSRLGWCAILCTLVCTILAGCGGGGGSASEATPEASPVVMAVSGARVTIAPMKQELHLLGTTVAWRHLTLRAPAAGRISEFALQVGAHVRKGAVVARVTNREAEAAANGLAVARLIDPSEAPGLAAALRRNPSAPAIPVAAPEDAIVAQPLVSDGQLVADLEPLADLIDPRGVYVEAEVPVAQLAVIRPGMPAQVTSPIHPGFVYSARVAALSPTLTQGGATVPARIEFDRAERLTEVSAPAEVVVTTAAVPAATVVPSAALFRDPSNDAWYVFVAGPDGRAHRTPVTLGIRNGPLVQVLTGLTAGQVVITSGGYALADGLRVTVTQ